MADSNRRQDQTDGAAETMRRGSQQATKVGAEVIGRAGKAAAQQGDAALEAAVSRTGEAMERGMEAARRTGAEVAQRSAAEVTRQAEAIETSGRQSAQVANGAVAGQAETTMRPAMVGMVALPQAFAGFLGDMARTNWQIGQEMLRLANPVALIELQQKMLHGYLDLILAGQATLGRTAQATEEALPKGRES
ncbi:hypothetical protein E2C06_05815 [Dankookia rubra]|uniref:Phasin domain-containing protein n=1 Tax=Dankookia rubra TaxID=1442381 RepID=A0A4R5QKY9_9PROT|nr:hypothetical protein [Dankookia rubra]TDH63357.1 hypothetical protein E2C06_05815 [Dankookia rubra]